ncbi:MAG: hypothetical protein R3C12_04075 [Planctomycetaceae bacterium]
MSTRVFTGQMPKESQKAAADFVTSLNPFLDRVGVKCTITDNWGDHDYTVTLNGEERQSGAKPNSKADGEGKLNLT